jgi:prepilin-type N-terminal cleavage/methylation domain-containing protein/prepilin-type processing-associated H-X9-DG protein
MGRSMKQGFSLVEMLVVMVIMSILAAIAVPALSAARESARATYCKNNLRQFGVGLQAMSSRTGAYCTGAFDWKRDGAVTEIGWVADMANEGIFTGDMLCPSNPAQVSETINDLLTAQSFSCNVNFVGPLAGVAPDGSPIVNPCRKILGLYDGGSPLTAGSEERRKLVEDEVVKAGFNTNYAASWYLVRGGVLIDDSGAIIVPAGCTKSLRERSSTTGPLKEIDCDKGRMRTTTIPMLGCANTTSGVLSQSVGNQPSGALLAMSFTAGPVLKTTMGLPNITPGGSIGGANGSWNIWYKQTLQDYRGFAPVHQRTCNVLFLDGSVRTLSDTNRDGLLNNGFSASAANGFQDSTVEVGSDQIRSLWNVGS